MLPHSMSRAIKRRKMHRLAARELPNTTGVENSHIVGETIVALLERGKTLRDISGSSDHPHRAEILEMMRIAARVYFPDQLEGVELLISEQVPNDLSSL